VILQTPSLYRTSPAQRGPSATLVQGEHWGSLTDSFLESDFADIHPKIVNLPNLRVIMQIPDTLLDENRRHFFTDIIRWSFRLPPPEKLSSDNFGQTSSPGNLSPGNLHGKAEKNFGRTGAPDNFGGDNFRGGVG